MVAGRIQVHVFDYLSLQDYLRAVFQAKKAVRATFSVRTWARSLGMKSPSLLAMSLTGKRLPNPELLERLSEYLEHTQGERKYFLSLADLGKTTPGSDGHRRLLKQLERVRMRGQTRRLSRETFEAISDWYFYAIREMVQLSGFEEDPHQIETQLFGRIPADVVARAIEILIRQDLLSRENGKLVYHSGHIQIESHESEKGLALYHRQILGLGQEAIHDFGEKERHVGGTTMCMDSRRMDEARQLIQEFHEKFIQTFEDSQKGDSVVQLESLLFPLAQNRAVSK